MTPPPDLAGAEVVAWRLDPHVFRHSWDSGVGAHLAGGRWNSKAGGHVIYCAIDPATAILEVAVHKGVKTLDTVRHVLTSLTVAPAVIASIHVLRPDDVPNSNWLHAGAPSIGQQAFGDALLRRHPFVLVPSVVSARSWNLIFDCHKAAGLYALRSQEDFGLDTRLHTAAF